jgi:hypothetical protein
MLALTAHENLQLQQFDSRTKSLNCHLEEVYLRPHLNVRSTLLVLTSVC